MYHPIESRKPLSIPANHPTLGYVRDQIEAAVDLTPRQRQDITSALRTLAKALDRRLEEIPAHPVHLRERIKDLNAAMVGIEERRWRNVLSLTRAALKHAGLARIPARSRVALDPDWKEAVGHLDLKSLQCGLSRLARYCTAASISPAEINDETMAKFLDDLEQGGLIRSPRSIHRTACLAWNKAVDTFPSWPRQKLKIPSYRKDYALPWSKFPASLKADADAYFEHLAGKDFLVSDIRPLKASSASSRSHQLHAFVSALVHQGRAPESLQSLADLVEISAVKLGLHFYLDRPGRKPAKQHAANIAGLLRAIGRYWVKVDEPHLNQLRLICKQLKTPETGLTEKNRRALRQFDDPKNVDALVNLPEHLMKTLDRRKSPVERALQVQTALALELLMMTAVRLGNLTGLDIERHFQRSVHGNAVHLVIPGEEVKNGNPHEVALPAPTVRLLDTFLREYRPLLLTSPSNWLFPGRNGNRRTDQTIRTRIVQAAKHHCGLILTPHQFRHIGAKFQLDAQPGSYGIVRLMLGHKSVDTTTQFYCGLEAVAACRHHDELILNLRGRILAKPVPPKAGVRP
jgi:integrase